MSKVDSHKIDSLSRKVKVRSSFHFTSDSPRINKLVSIHGAIRNESNWANRGYANQGQPNAYNRTYVDYSLNLGGIPFRGSIGLSSDDYIYGRNLSMLNLNFDIIAYKRILEQKLARLNLKSKESLLADSIWELVLGYKDEVGRIKQKLTNKQYLISISKYQDLVNRAQYDSTFLAKKKIKVQYASQQLSKFSAERNRMDSLLLRASQLEAKLNYARALYQFQREGLIEFKTNELDTFQRMRKISTVFNIIESIRRFELGDFYPSYSSLILQGVSVRGANIELNPKEKFYLGFCLGYRNQPSFLNSFDFSIKKGNPIQALRFGIGSLDQSYIGIVYLRGENAQRDSFSLIKSIPLNQVIGIQGRIMLGNFGMLEIEKAWSNTYKLDNPITLSDLINSITNSLFNSSTSIRLAGKIAQTRTNYLFSYRSDDPFYYSLGNPANRKDAYRLDGKIEQSLFKGKSKPFVLFRQDADNVSGMKGYTTRTRSYGAGMTLRYAGMNFSMDGREIKVQNLSQSLLISKVNMLAVGFGRNTQINKRNLITNMICTYSDMTLLSKPSFKTQMIQFTSTLVYSSKWSYSGTGNYIRNSAFKEDSANSYNVGISFTHSPYKRIQYGIGYRLLETSSAERRDILSLSINGSLLGLTYAATGEWQNVKSEQYKTYDERLSARVNVTYRF